jgi:hypothetical protein
MMLFGYGRENRQQSRLPWPRKRVIAGNLTHEDAFVQFSCVQNVNFYLSRDRGPQPESKLSEILRLWPDLTVSSP